MASENKKYGSEFFQEARERREESIDAEYQNRKDGLDDLNFIHGKGQWPEEIKTQRKLDGRPCLTFNMLPQFIRQETGNQRQNRPSIKIRAVDDVSDPGTAEIKTGLIKNIEYTSNANIAYDNAYFGALANGFGYMTLDKDYVDDDIFEQELKIKPIEDPFSVHLDLSDDIYNPKWGFIIKNISRKEFERKYPKADPMTVEQAEFSSWEKWYRTDSLTISEYWWKEETKRTICQLSNGNVIYKDEITEEMKAEMEFLNITIVNSRETKTHKVKYGIITAHEFVDGPNDWDGKYIPIVPVLGEQMFIEGKRYLKGLIRDAKDSQRAYNYWRTTITEVIALAPKAPYVGTVKQFDGYENYWKNANVKNYSFLPYNPDPTAPGGPKRQSPPGIPTGAFNEAEVAKNDMKAAMGIYDAGLGKQGNEKSGRAILARQKESDQATFVFLDNLTRGIAHLGRIILDMLPKVYDTNRVVRLRNPDDTEELVEINDIFGIHDLAAGKYDSYVDVGPSYTTQRLESAASMLDFVSAYPNAGPVMGGLIAKNMDWPGAEEIGRRLEALISPEIREANPGNQGGGRGPPQFVNAEEQNAPGGIAPENQFIPN